MQIVLLLRKVSHDQSTTTGDDRAFVGWGHTPAAGADKDDSDPTKGLPYLALRKEEWGGIAIHGPSLAVFHVDHDAYILLERLKSGECLADIKDEPRGSASDDIDEFIRLVKEHNLERP